MTTAWWPKSMLLVVGTLTLCEAGCGSGDQHQLTVSAASSLQDAFTKYANTLRSTDVKQSFAGSDQLAAQIRTGATPDVFASADTKYPQQLYREGLVQRPRVFAANRLVIAVPKNSDISSIGQLAEPGVDLVIGDSSVPVGSYTREVFRHLPPGQRSKILSNVRSEEPEASAILAKLTQNAADAGFVYATDAKAAGSSLRIIKLPANLQPDVAYSVAVLKNAPNPNGAQRFVAGLFPGHAGAQQLHAAGFLPPPRG